MPEPLTNLRLTIPSRVPHLRVIGLVYGALLLLWSSLEDNSVLPVVLLGGGFALLITTAWVTRRFGGRNFDERGAFIAAALVGGLTGLIAAVASAGLMLIKVGLHSDLYPDYPFGLMVATLARAPLWALVGMFVGIGVLLTWWAIQSQKR